MQTTTTLSKPNYAAPPTRTEDTGFSTGWYAVFDGYYDGAPDAREDTWHNFMGHGDTESAAIRDLKWKRMEFLLTQDECDAIDVREKIRASLKSHDYSDGDRMCHECGDVDFVVADWGLCTPCYIDDAMLNGEPENLGQLVLKHFEDELGINDKDRYSDFLKKYVEFSRDADEKATEMMR